MDKDILAKKAYEAYCKGVGGVAFNGDTLPTAEEFFNDPTKAKQANAWREALRPIYELLVETTQNLGHPAYGHSSATTFGIDELRDKSFDFLGIPKEE